jgi:predicted dehydrogenase
MALDMTPEQKAVGKANFQRAVGKLAQEPEAPPLMGITRRRFMQGLVATGATLPVAAAAYFGYNRANFGNEPIKAGIIGTGDEGAVLVDQHNKDYVRFVAYSDIRPYNQKRIFDGMRFRDGKWEPEAGRRGFNALYNDGRDARSMVSLHTDYKQMLRDPEIKMVVIALPLNLHFQATMDALDAGKHVLCEKLMAYNIRQCKQMIKKAKDKNLLLAVGHQRHYSMLYAHAVESLETGILGRVQHIRALWHRNNSVPGRDSWRPAIHDRDKDITEAQAKSYGFKNKEELIRWRLYRRTGGGLMAELGSHQLDACSIFLGKRRNPSLYPICVIGSGGKNFYGTPGTEPDDREVEDHVYCMFEFKGANYDKKLPRYDDHGRPVANDIVTVTYSSISTNGFEPYGECVMGTKGTLVVDSEQLAMLYGPAGRNTAMTVSAGALSALTASGSTDAPAERQAASLGADALGHGPVSRGYREEMEHFAYCIRMRDQGMERDRAELKPRCDGKSAMADAIMALAANEAIKRQARIDFEPEWFDPDSDKVPTWDPPAEGV